MGHHAYDMSSRAICRRPHLVEALAHDLVRWIDALPPHRGTTSLLGVDGGFLAAYTAARVLNQRNDSLRKYVVYQVTFSMRRPWYGSLAARLTFPAGGEAPAYVNNCCIVSIGGAAQYQVWEQTESLHEADEIEIQSVSDGIFPHMAKMLGAGWVKDLSVGFGKQFLGHSCLVPTQEQVDRYTGRERFVT